MNETFFVYIDRKIAIFEALKMIDLFLLQGKSNKLLHKINDGEFLITENKELAEKETFIKVAIVNLTVFLSSLI